jgi:hypothetical protein
MISGGLGMEPVEQNGQTVEHRYWITARHYINKCGQFQCGPLPTDVFEH